MANQDWHRREVLRAVYTLVEENLMTFKLAQTYLEAYDEKADALGTLQLLLDFDDKGKPVSLSEALTEYMTSDHEQDSPEREQLKQQA